MKEIPLRNGGFTLVDDEDYDWLCQYKWRKTARGYVARGALKKDGCTGTILMHRQIMGAGRGKYVDHKNHNPLDNCRENLRVCDPWQNGANRRKLAPATSPYKGVSRFRDGFRAQLVHQGDKIFIGVYRSQERAAEAYNEVALKLRGPYALLNEIPPLDCA